MGMYEKRKDFYTSFSEALRHVDHNEPSKKTQIVKNVDDWWKKVQDKHRQIRKFIGGTYRNFDVRVDSPDMCVAVDQLHYSRIAARINTLMPEYQKTYQGFYDVNLAHFLREGVVGNFYPNEGTRIAKHITTYMNKRKSISDEAKAEINKLLAEVGELNAKKNNRTKHSECVATIHTAARAFFLIGKYGGNPSSCWRHGQGAASLNRYRAGLIENSFVFLLRPKIDGMPADPAPASCISRSIGYWLPEKRTFRLSNGYLRQIGTQHITGCIKQVAEQLYPGERFYAGDDTRTQVTGRTAPGSDEQHASGYYTDAFHCLARPENVQITPTDQSILFRSDLEKISLGNFSSEELEVPDMFKPMVTMKEPPAKVESKIVVEKR